MGTLKRIMVAPQHGWSLGLVILSANERVTEKIKPIDIEDFATLDIYRGKPKSDAIMLKDGSILQLEKEVVDTIDGINVYMLFCRMNNTKRFIALEFRNYTYQTVNRE